MMTDDYVCIPNMELHEDQPDRTKFAQRNVAFASRGLYHLTPLQ